MAARYSARMSVMHVVEYLPVEPMGEALLPAINMEDELVKTARKRLDDLVEELGVDLVQHQVVVGNIKAEIVNYARENAVDLIVLGSHERHGLSVLGEPCRGHGPACCAVRCACRQDQGLTGHRCRRGSRVMSESDTPPVPGQGADDF